MESRKEGKGRHEREGMTGKKLAERVDRTGKAGHETEKADREGIDRTGKAG